MKQKVYIDFEAIPTPFNEVIGVQENFPFAYSIAIEKDGEFQTRFFLLNSHQFHSAKNNIYFFIKTQIIKDIKILIGQEDFIVNEETIIFNAFNPKLEKSIILNEKCFGTEMKVENVFNFRPLSVSLSKLTVNFSKEKKQYFPKTSEWLYENIKVPLLGKRHTTNNKINDGAMAGMIGMFIFTYNNEIISEWFKGKRINNLILKSMIPELEEYSLDDTKRMFYLIKNKKECKVIYDKHIEINKKKRKLGQIISSLKTFIEFLEKYNSDITVKNIIKDLSKKLEENKKIENELIKTKDDNENNKKILKIKKQNKSIKQKIKKLEKYNINMTVNNLIEKNKATIKHRAKRLNKLRDKIVV